MEESRKYYALSAFCDGREVNRVVSYDAKLIGDAVKIDLTGMLPVDKIAITVSAESEALHHRRKHGAKQ